jgi:acyl-coenzyme A thioesterase PaaI-like protein
VPKDIRTLSEDEYWKTFERKWLGLLSYRYLGRTHTFDKNGDNRMKLRRDMRNANGGIMAAPLCIASPESGGMDDDEFVPNPVIASMLILDDARDVREIEIRPEVLRIGRRNGFSRARIVDADDPPRLIALSQGMGVSIGDPPPGFEQLENPPMELGDEDSLPPLHEAFGARPTDDGAWELGELSEDLASPDAALHIGPIHVALEAAANDYATAAAGGGVQIESWSVMFVARGKVGPFRIEGEAIRQGSRVGCELAMHDLGNGSRLTSTANAMFRVL